MHLTNKEKYATIEDRLPLFFKPWYLDAVTQDGDWDVSIVMSEKLVLGVWPYFVKRKYSLTYLTQPHLTPFLGPLIFNDDIEKRTTLLSREKKILGQLEEQLPQTSFQVIQGHPSFTYWNPLAWKGFSQTTRYTYQLDLTQSEDELKSQYDRKIRHTLKAKQIEIREELNVALLYDLTIKTFQRFNQAPPFGKDFFMLLFNELVTHKACFQLVAVVDDIAKGSVLIVYDEKTAYLLITGREDDIPNGLVAKLIDKAIFKSKELGLDIFDFEGSMIESIESFFRSFGGKPTPYFKLFRAKNKMIDLLLQVFNKR